MAGFVLIRTHQAYIFARSKAHFFIFEGAKHLNYVDKGSIKYYKKVNSVIYMWFSLVF